MTEIEQNLLMIANNSAESKEKLQYLANKLYDLVSVINIDLVQDVENQKNLELIGYQLVTHRCLLDIAQDIAKELKIAINGLEEQ